MTFVESRLGTRLPVVGQGTWRMGERRGDRSEEVAALRLGLDLGLSLIDTAEMYGSGGAERIVAEAIDGRRDEVLIVSKVLPHNASHKGTLRAAESSLKRLRTDRIDLYLLHWPGSHPLEETFAAFESLVEQGKIRHYGVSNFDADEMQVAEATAGGSAVVVDQVLYNLERRSVEKRLLPWCRERKITNMAYSPLEQGRLQPHPTLSEIARHRGLTPYEIALAWTLREPGVVAIPKAVRPEHVRRNATAATLQLDPDELSALEQAFPAPPQELPLEML